MRQLAIVDPGGWISWILVGLLAGAIASRVVRGRGLGCVLDIVVGIVGAFVGGFLVSFLIPQATVFHFWGTLIVATLGAVVLLALLQLLGGGRHRR